ncbi:MAG: hypothetical protein O7D86_02955 [Proteobacteria bacterium]|nr:hypothetical protein [Pseudomonadota bacterium]
MTVIYIETNCPQTLPEPANDDSVWLTIVGSTLQETQGNEQDVTA